MHFAESKLQTIVILSIFCCDKKNPVIVVVRRRRVVVVACMQEGCLIEARAIASASELRATRNGQNNFEIQLL